MYKNVPRSIDATDESTRLGRLVNHSSKKANCYPKVPVLEYRNTVAYSMFCVHY